jgi:hypothetical protein
MLGIQSFINAAFSTASAYFGDLGKDMTGDVDQVGSKLMRSNVQTNALTAICDVRSCAHPVVYTSQGKGSMMMR